jgi:hypothetical protein
MYNSSQHIGRGAARHGNLTHTRSLTSSAPAIGAVGALAGGGGTWHSSGTVHESELECKGCVIAKYGVCHDWAPLVLPGWVAHPHPVTGPVRACLQRPYHPAVSRML